MCRLDDLQKERRELFDLLRGTSSTLKEQGARKTHSDHMAGEMSTISQCHSIAVTTVNGLGPRIRAIELAIEEERRSPTPENEQVPCANGRSCKGDGFIPAARLEIIPWTKVCGACARAEEEKAARRR